MRAAVIGLLFDSPSFGTGHAEVVPGSRAEIAPSSAPAVREAAPAVTANPIADDPFFGRFFGDMAPVQPRVRNSLGPGVILAPHRLVFSNTIVV